MLQGLTLSLPIWKASVRAIRAVRCFLSNEVCMRTAAIGCRPDAADAESDLLAPAESLV